MPPTSSAGEGRSIASVTGGQSSTIVINVRSACCSYLALLTERHFLLGGDQSVADGRIIRARSSGSINQRRRVLTDGICGWEAIQSLR